MSVQRYYLSSAPSRGSHSVTDLKELIEQGIITPYALVHENELLGEYQPRRMARDVVGHFNAPKPAPIVLNFETSSDHAQRTKAQLRDEQESSELDRQRQKKDVIEGERLEREAQERIKNERLGRERLEREKQERSLVDVRNSNNSESFKMLNKIKFANSRNKLFLLALFIGLGFWGMVVYNHVDPKVEQNETNYSHISKTNSFLRLIVYVLLSSFPVELLTIYYSTALVEHADSDRRQEVLKRIGDLIVGSLLTLACSVGLSFILFIFKIKTLFGIPGVLF